MVEFINNGVVNLYYNGFLKFSIIVDGVNVIGLFIGGMNVIVIVIEINFLFGVMFNI